MNERWWELVLDTEPAPDQSDTLPGLEDDEEVEFRSYA